MCVSFCVCVSASVCASVCKLTCMPMCGCCFCISSLLFVILSLIFNVFDLPVLHQALGAEPLMHVYCGQNLSEQLERSSCGNPEDIAVVWLPCAASHS